jgi:glycolate oxidase FAD binding subunit
MSGANDIQSELQRQVRDAIEDRRALLITGGNSKRFYGRTPVGERLQVGAHRGVVHYEPTELVLTARAGTPLAEIDSLLAGSGQMLAFEPPHFGKTATLGGTIACGLSGPRRMQAGAARDFVLGARIINGHGEFAHFGGEVMKNVAGYDVARLMTGALGTLGVLLEISLKVLPRPAMEITLALDMAVDEAIAHMNRWSAKPLPVSASCHDGARLYVRLSGTETGVHAARTRIGGEEIRNGDHFWYSLREQEHHFFHGTEPLWRMAVLPSAAAEEAGGHATCFRGGDRHGAVFHPLARPLAQLHGRIKKNFDPAGIFNPGRMLADW